MVPADVAILTTRIDNQLKYSLFPYNRFIHMANNLSVTEKTLLISVIMSFRAVFHCRLNGTRRCQAMPFDECCRGYSLRFAVFGDGIEQLFLFFGYVRQYFAKNSIVRGNHVVNCRSKSFERTHLAFGSVGECLVERLLNVIGMTFEQIVNSLCIVGSNSSVTFLEMADDERNINFRNNRFQFQHIRAMVERTCRRHEHLLHHVALASGEDEVAVTQLLNVRSQLRLDIFLRVLGDLLELVNRHDAWFICMT